MKIQKRKISKPKAGHPRVGCYRENRMAGDRNHSISIEKCIQCKHFLRRVKGYIYCKKISAPYWLEDKVIINV